MAPIISTRPPSVAWVPIRPWYLINGKRSHQSRPSSTYLAPGAGAIPAPTSMPFLAAIDRVEVLRDGASAQYGSDAIAGVVNVILKSSVNEFTANINSGVYDAKSTATTETTMEKASG